MSRASSYPLPSAALRPSWANRRSQAFAAIAVAACLAAIAARMPIRLAEIDDVALRIILPAGLAFVLALSPIPGTAVGRIARELTVLGLAASMFAGNYVPIMVACYPLILMASVVIAWAREVAARRRSER
jgi:hypothetical protein